MSKGQKTNGILKTGFIGLPSNPLMVKDHGCKWTYRKPLFIRTLQAFKVGLKYFDIRHYASTLVFEPSCQSIHPSFGQPQTPGSMR